MKLLSTETKNAKLEQAPKANLERSRVRHCGQGA